jgi:hypothetical protein
MWLSHITGSSINKTVTVGMLFGAEMSKPMITAHLVAVIASPVCLASSMSKTLPSCCL